VFSCIGNYFLFGGSHNTSLERRKEVASSRRGDMCGYATKDIAKEVEEKSSIY